MFLFLSRNHYVASSELGVIAVKRIIYQGIISIIIDPSFLQISMPHCCIPFVAPMHHQIPSLWLQWKHKYLLDPMVFFPYFECLSHHLIPSYDCNGSINIFCIQGSFFPYFVCLCSVSVGQYSCIIIRSQYHSNENETGRWKPSQTIFVNHLENPNRMSCGRLLLSSQSLIKTSPWHKDRYTDKYYILAFFSFFFSLSVNWIRLYTISIVTLLIVSRHNPRSPFRQ